MINGIQKIIEEYKNLIGKDPYVILLSPNEYFKMQKEAREIITYHKRYINQQTKYSVNYATYYNIPLEMSNYLPKNVSAIALCKQDYENYLVNKSMKDKECWDDFYEHNWDDKWDNYKKTV